MEEFETMLEEALGTGANEQAAAEPAGEAGEAPREVPQQPPAEEERPAEESQEETRETPGEMSVEERRRNAARRRQLEQETQARAWQAKVDAAYAEAFRQSPNPYTGQPITNEAEYLAYRQTFEEEQRKQALEGAGIRCV